MSATRIGKPRRHLTALDVNSSGRRPVLRLRIGHQREWRDLARTMARLAMLLQDGKSVPVEGWWGLSCWWIYRRQNDYSCQQPCDHSNHDEWIVSRIRVVCLSAAPCLPLTFMSVI